MDIKNINGMYSYRLRGVEDMNTNNKVKPSVVVASAIVTTVGMGSIKLASLALKAVVTVIISL